MLDKYNLNLTVKKIILILNKLVELLLLLDIYKI